MIACYQNGDKPYITNNNGRGQRMGKYENEN